MIPPPAPIGPLCLATKASIQTHTPSLKIEMAASFSTQVQIPPKLTPSGVAMTSAKPMSNAALIAVTTPSPAVVIAIPAPVISNRMV